MKRTETSSTDGVDSVEKQKAVEVVDDKLVEVISSHNGLMMSPRRKR